MPYYVPACALVGARACVCACVRLRVYIFSELVEIEYCRQCLLLIKSGYVAKYTKDNQQGITHFLDKSTKGFSVTRAVLVGVNGRLNVYDSNYTSSAPPKLAHISRG